MTQRPEKVASAAAFYRPYLYRVALEKIGNERRASLDPSDIVQQALLAAFEGAGAFRGSTDEELKAWLRSILARSVSAAVRRFRAKKRDRRRQRTLPAHREVRDPRAETPSKILRQSELLRCLARAMLELPESQRTALRLRYFEGRRLKEIALSMGRSRDSVAGLLRRGLARLREVLEPLR